MSNLKLIPTLCPNQNLSRLELLPTELVQNIVSHLDFVDKTTLSAVSQQMNSLVGPIKFPSKWWRRMNAMRMASEHPDKSVRACLYCLELISCNHWFQTRCLYFAKSTPEEKIEAMDAWMESEIKSPLSPT